MEKEQIIEFLDKPDTVPYLQSLASGEEIKKYLNDNGIEISLEKANELKKIFELFEEKNGEISKEELENIGGGKNFTQRDYENMIKGLVCAALVGTLSIGGGKFIKDVKEEYDNRKGDFRQNMGKLRDIGSKLFNEIGHPVRSPYRKLVVYTANFLNDD